MYEFRWNDWNIDHIAGHGMRPTDAEYLVNHARRPFPKYQGDGRYLVMGQAANGSYAQVVFIFSPPKVVFVIHARLLTSIEKRRLRRRRRK